MSKVLMIAILIFSSFGANAGTRYKVSAQGKKEIVGGQMWVCMVLASELENELDRKMWAKCARKGAVPIGDMIINQGCKQGSLNSSYVYNKFTAYFECS